jgi:hypothetical protein
MDNNSLHCPTSAKPGEMCKYGFESFAVSNKTILECYRASNLSENGKKVSVVSERDGHAKT